VEDEMDGVCSMDGREQEGRENFWWENLKGTALLGKTVCREKENITFEQLN